MGMWIQMSPSACPRTAGSLEAVTRDDSRVSESGQEEGRGSWDKAGWANTQDPALAERPPFPGAVGFLTVISKGCTSHCVDDSQNYYLGKKNITCCSSDLCNANGAHALQPALVTLALLTAVGGLLLWGPSRM